MNQRFLGLCAVVLAACGGEPTPSAPGPGMPAVDSGLPPSVDSGLPGEGDSGPPPPPPGSPCPEAPPATNAPCDVGAFDPLMPYCVYPGDTTSPGQYCTCRASFGSFLCTSGAAPCPPQKPVEGASCAGEAACGYGGSMCDCLVLEAGDVWHCS